jgi:tetratricopeptide (TPR) repeat protein
MGYSRAALALRPDSAMANNNLGIGQHANGNLDEAIACFHKAVKIDPAYALAHTNLGWTLEGKGEFEMAIACYRHAISVEPKYALAHNNLIRALAEQGHFAQAQQAAQQALKALSPSQSRYKVAQRQLKGCEELLALEQKLPAVLVGKTKPADVTEQLKLAVCAQYKKLYTVAVKLYQAAFASQPPLAEKYRYDAARAAVQAGTGQDKNAVNLDEKDKAALRQQALEWLKADSMAQGKRLQDNPTSAAQVQMALKQWQSNVYLAGVRQAKEMAKLPHTERQAWKALWAEVQALHDQAGRVKKEIEEEARQLQKQP